MDDQHFDELVKRLSAGVDRRRALRNVLGGLVATVGGAAALEAEAKPGQQAKRQGKDKKGKAQGKEKHKGKAHGKHKGKHKDQAGNELLPFCSTTGACQSSAECCDPNVATCGTTGATAGQCCRTTLGIYCDTTQPFNNCCAPNWVCATPGVFPAPMGGGCQCNTAGGFTQQDGGCHCLTGCIIDGACVDASHCATTTTTVAPTTTTTTAPMCVPVGGTCNACHACCAGSICTDPTHACNGNGGTCVATTTTTVAPTTTTTVAPTTTTAAPVCAGVLCPPDPHGQRKCCPVGHTCNPNKNGTYNCGRGRR